MMAIQDKKHKLNKLKEEHRLLDEQIAHLMMSSVYDQLAVQRLKKQKLQLKDKINKLTTELIPDIIA